MTQVRMNLRKVAMIVACLAVTAIFAACDETDPDDDGGGSGNGKIDQKLIGHWRYEGFWEQPWYKYYYDYYFDKDGTFKYFYTPASNQVGSTTKTEGKFTVSDGKVYMTEVVYMKGDPKFEAKYPDRVHEYEFGKTAEGKECLKIGTIRLLAEDGIYVDKSWAINFTRF